MRLAALALGLSSLTLGGVACTTTVGEPIGGGTADASPADAPPPLPQPDASWGGCPLAGPIDPATLQYDDLSGGGPEGLTLLWRAGDHELFLAADGNEAPFASGVGPGTTDVATLASLIPGESGLTLFWATPGVGKFDAMLGATAGRVEIVAVTLPTTVDGSVHLRLHDVVFRELEADAGKPYSFGAPEAGGCVAALPSFDATVTVKVGAG